MRLARPHSWPTGALARRASSHKVGRLHLEHKRHTEVDLGQGRAYRYALESGSVHADGDPSCSRINLAGGRGGGIDCMLVRRCVCVVGVVDVFVLVRRCRYANNRVKTRWGL